MKLMNTIPTNNFRFRHNIFWSPELKSYTYLMYHIKTIGHTPQSSVKYFNTTFCTEEKLCLCDAFNHKHSNSVFAEEIFVILLFWTTFLYVYTTRYKTNHQPLKHFIDAIKHFSLKLISSLKFLSTFFIFIGWTVPESV